MCGQVELAARPCHTHSFSFSWNRKKERRTKRGESKSERDRERVSQRPGRWEERGREGDGQETFVVEWTSTDNPWHTAL